MHCTVQYTTGWHRWCFDRKSAIKCDFVYWVVSLRLASLILGCIICGCDLSLGLDLDLELAMACQTTIKGRLLVCGGNWGLENYLKDVMGAGRRFETRCSWFF